MGFGAPLTATRGTYEFNAHFISYVLVKVAFGAPEVGTRHLDHFRPSLRTLSTIIFRYQGFSSGPSPTENVTIGFTLPADNANIVNLINI